MKKTLFLSTMFLFSAIFAYAQRGNGDNERIQQMRVEFFNQELQLTTEEATAFWPIYEQYRKDQKILRQEYRQDRNMELMTDAEAERYVEDHLILEEKQIALKRKYIAQFKGVISIRKIAMINRTERKFKKNLLHKIQDRRGARRNRN